MTEKKDIIKSNLAELDAMTDDDIDYSEIPDLGDAEKLWDRGVVKKAGEPLFAVL